MKKAILILFVSQLAFSTYANQSSLALKRFALFIGSNNGGTERVLLRYAESDAHAMASVMQEVGGILSEDSLVILSPTADDIRNGFSRIKQQASLSRETARRVEFLLYYSGHSDEKGILLGGDTMSYRDLKDEMMEIDADVNIAILDSCSSGAFTRLKGGTRQAPFLLDDSVQMKGHAFLTSSSADEAAQESDRIQASFFTHYLISGLRGAADVTRDGQITLNEAYHFAFSETLARTENTLGGAQHPSYNIQLTGTGDLTLSDLRATGASITLGEDVRGRIFVRDSSGRLMVEMEKHPDISVTLALPAGSYTITLDQESKLYETDVLLQHGSKNTLALNRFFSKNREKTTIRGSNPIPEDVPDDMFPIWISFIPGVRFGRGVHVVNNFSINLLIGNSRAVHGCEIGPIINIVEGEVTGAILAGVGNIVAGDLSGAQLAGVFNITEGSSTGYLGAGVMNISHGPSSAVQTAGVFNIMEGSSNGFQAAGVFNITNSSLHGVHAAGVFNIAEGKVNGAQVAGVFNIAEGNLDGAQISGIFNRADYVSGAQIGLINISSRVSGTQIGLVNIAEKTVNGAQIGLINIADEVHGMPLGLVNIMRRGTRFSAWYTESEVAYLGFQSGNRFFYSLFYGGFEITDSPDWFTAGIGLGFKIPVGPFFTGMDLSAKYVLDDISEQGFMQTFDTYLSPVFPSIRLSAGVEIFSHLTLFGGMAWDVHIPGATQETLLHKGSPKPLTLWNTEMLFYPKIFMGIQL